MELKNVSWEKSLIGWVKSDPKKRWIIHIQVYATEEEIRALRTMDAQEIIDRLGLLSSKRKD